MHNCLRSSGAFAISTARREEPKPFTYEDAKKDHEEARVLADLLAAAIRGEDVEVPKDERQPDAI